jgi:prepilin-type N-terminal cleavage/methylation domain-containing protein
VKREKFKVSGSKSRGVARFLSKGFTVIEVLVAISIFSVAILGLAVGATSVMRANQVSYNHTTASNLAQDKLEELKARPGSIATGGPENEPVGNTTFTRSWTVTPSDPVGGVTRIDVQVDWTDYTAQSVSISAAVNQ